MTDLSNSHHWKPPERFRTDISDIRNEVARFNVLTFHTLNLATSGGYKTRGFWAPEQKMIRHRAERLDDIVNALIKSRKTRHFADNKPLSEVHSRSNVLTRDLTPCQYRREVDCRALIIDKGSRTVRAGSENATSETIIDRGTGMLCQVR